MLYLLFTIVLFILPITAVLLIVKSSGQWLRWIGIVYLSLVGLLLLVVLIVQAYYGHQSYTPANKISWGVSFSASTSTFYGSDWHAAYEAMISDLKPAIIRLPVNWDEIEPNKGSIDFTNLDWQVEKATESHIPIILAIGQKAPRWPECHLPSWVDMKDSVRRLNETKTFIQTVAEHYVANTNISWQVENEPFLKITHFGSCPRLTPAELNSEIRALKKVKPNDYIITTDSGEGGGWNSALKASGSNAMGVTLYRKVYNSLFKEQEYYPYAPEFYTARRDLAHLLTGTKKPIFISELQMEPWAPGPLTDFSPKEQAGFFTDKDFDQAINYAEKARLEPVVLTWGVEWWYRMKEQGISSYWDKGESLLANSQTRCQGESILSKKMAICR